MKITVLDTKTSEISTSYLNNEEIARMNENEIMNKLMPSDAEILESERKIETIQILMEVGLL